MIRRYETEGVSPSDADLNFAFEGSLARSASTLRETDMAFQLGGKPKPVQETHSALSKPEPGARHHLPTKGRVFDRRVDSGDVDPELSTMPGLRTLTREHQLDKLEVATRARDQGNIDLIELALDARSM